MSQLPKSRMSWAEFLVGSAFTAIILSVFLPWLQVVRQRQHTVGELPRLVLCWSNAVTGQTGHGSPVEIQQAQTWLEWYSVGSTSMVYWVVATNR